MERGGFRRTVGTACAGVQGPFDAGDIGQIGLLQQLVTGADETRQNATPLGQVAARRRMRVPERARQGGKAVCAQQLGQHRVGDPQCAFGQRMAIVLVDF